SPSTRTNSIFGRYILLPAESLSKGATIGSAVDAASISGIRMVTFWNWQRPDCGRSTKMRTHVCFAPESGHSPLVVVLASLDAERIRMFALAKVYLTLTNCWQRSKHQICGALLGDLSTSMG